MTRAQKFLFGSVAGLLLAVLGLEWAGARRVAESGSPAGGKRLAAILPLTAPGYVVHDEPIAATEEMKRAVGELLNFSDAAYRIYQAPHRRLAVYVAGWDAGRMSPRMVAGHTPDVCWPGAGWTRAREREVALPGLGEVLWASGFAPGEMRVFAAQGRPEYVVFWHRVGDRLLSYQSGGPPPWWAWLADLWRDGLAGRKSQIFIRVSSDMPLEGALQDPALATVWAALRELGIGEKG